MKVTPIRVLSVEDDSAIAIGLEHYLKNEGFDVSNAETGSAALTMVKEKDPHIILLDIRLPDVNGFELCKRLRSEGRTCPILIMTALDEEADRVIGLELGADDYIVKPYKLREVAARIRAAARRAYGELSIGHDGRQAVFGDVRIDFDAMQVYKAGEAVQLTAIELRLVRKLVGYPGRAFSRDELITALYGDENWNCDRRTIDVHVLHVREKLERDPRVPCHFKTVHGLGYKFER